MNISHDVAGPWLLRCYGGFSFVVGLIGTAFFGLLAIKSGRHLDSLWDRVLVYLLCFAGSVLTLVGGAMVAGGEATRPTWPRRGARTATLGSAAILLTLTVFLVVRARDDLGRGVTPGMFIQGFSPVLVIAAIAAVMTATNAWVAVALRTRPTPEPGTPP